jgi:general secretion pathway protein C
MKISPRDLIWVNLGLLALAAYWGASMVSAAIAARLTASPELHLSQPPPPLVREARRPQTYYASISQRDVFNSVKQPVEAPPEPKVRVECKSKLWGVAVHGDGSSYCIIEEPSTHKQKLYGINEKTVNCGTVKQVEWDRVILDHDGQEEVLELASVQGTPGRGPGMAPAVALSNQPAANPHIQQVSETEYNIDRSEVDQALDNMNQLFTQIRAVPHFEGGQSTGFRLFAIRQNSIFDQIGLRNGDIIQSVNGMELSDPSKALGMIGQLRDSNQLTVQVLRNKTNMTVSYRIR